MPWAGKPHWRHEAGIHIYALTLLTSLKPHSSLSPQNSNRTSSQQIIRMPSTRTGWQYSARPSMPSSPTLRQGSYVSSPFSTTSTSVLRSSPLQMMRTNPQHHPLWIWQNHQWWQWLQRSYGNTLPTNQFIFQNYHYVTFMDHCTETKKRSGQTRDWGKKVVYGVGRIRFATGIASTLKHTLSRILLTSSMTTHSILPCTKPGNKIPYPTTNVTTTRNTRKPNRYWRWQWRVGWTRQQFLYSRINILHTSLLPPTLSRMHWLTTSILWMSTIHMQSLLPMSTRTLSFWLSKKLKPVTSTIVGDIVTNSFFSFTPAYHALPYSFLFTIDMHSP